MSRLAGVAVDAQQRIWLTDWLLGRLYVLDAKGTHGYKGLVPLLGAATRGPLCPARRARLRARARRMQLPRRLTDRYQDGEA